VRPFDDWMELELWEGQRAKTEVMIALPDSVERKDIDEAAVFKVLTIGPDVKKCKVGDVVQFYGLSAPQLIRLPNGRKTIVAQDQYACFVLDPQDLERSK